MNQNNPTKQPGTLQQLLLVAQQYRQAERPSSHLFFYSYPPRTHTAEIKELRRKKSHSIFLPRPRTVGFESGKKGRKRSKAKPAAGLGLGWEGMENQQTILFFKRRWAKEFGKRFLIVLERLK